jgi:serine protease Do
MAEPQEEQKLPRPTTEQVSEPPAIVDDIPKKVRPAESNTAQHPGSIKNFLSTIGLCIITSVVTVVALLASGWVSPNVEQTITENREKIVLQEGEIVADVFKNVSPSTVAITTHATTASPVFGSSLQQSGAGSGVIISKDGYVLTNKHVIPAGTSQVTVMLADGREFNDVTVVGRDPFNDIAFLKIDGVSDLPAAAIGDSDLVEPGQKVVAIGNALGEFRNSVTAGIISGLGRPIEASDGLGSSEKLENLFQTDAAINPGNSGGPLVNLKGEVIGINTAIAEESDGIGFAIPINDAKGLIKTVLEQGKIIKPYLGVRYLTLTKEVAQQLGVSVSAGAYIDGSNGEPAVIAGSPADKAGLREKDIITKVGNKVLSESSGLASTLSRYAPGETVELTIVRDGNEQVVSVTLEAYPN